MSLCSWLNWKWDVLIPFAAKSKGSFKVQRKKKRVETKYRAIFSPWWFILLFLCFLSLVQRWLPWPGAGIGLCWQGRLLPDGAPEQWWLFPPSCCLRFLRCPLRPLHNAPTWKQTETAPRFHEGRREPEATTPLPVAAHQRQPPSTAHACPFVGVQPG